MTGRLFLVLSSSITALILTIGWIQRCGVSRFMRFFLAVTGYGILRAWVVAWISSSSGVARPYIMMGPTVQWGPVSLQELVGWFIAVSLAWFWATWVLRQWRLEWTISRVVFLSMYVMGALSILVERAAVEAGWWVWTLRRTRGLVSGVPWVGVLDWSYVAVDFLWPYLAWTRRALRWHRGLALAAFPLHMLGHRLAGVGVGIPGPVSGWLSLYDGVHLVLVVGLLASAGMRTVGTAKDADEPSHLSMEYAILATAMVVGVAMVVIGMHASVGSALWGGFPFVALLCVGWLGRTRVITWKGWERRTAIGVAIVIFLTVIGLRQPYHKKNRVYADTLGQAIHALREGRTLDADQWFLKASEVRPEHPAAYLGRAFLRWRAGHWDEAIPWIERVLELAPLNPDALWMRIQYEMMMAQWDEASNDLERLRRVRATDARVDVWLQVARFRSGKLSMEAYKERLERVLPRVRDTEERQRLCRIARDLKETVLMNLCQTKI